MNATVRRRLEALEARTSTEAVRLIFADGSSTEIRGPNNFVLDLFSSLQQGAEIGPLRAAQVEMIRRSVDAREPGGSRLVEVLRMLLNGPVRAQGDISAESRNTHD
jgi:hypothetical protein